MPAKDPLLNEPMIIETLDYPVSSSSVNRLQTGALMSVINAFDRKIEREPFCKLASAALSMHSYLARLHLAEAIRALVYEDKLDLSKMEEACAYITRDAEIERKVLLRALEEVASCPTSEDKIH